LPDAPRLSDALRALLPYLEAFRRPGYRHGEWRVGTEYPIYDFAPTTAAFLRALAENGIVQPFDWIAWKDEAVRLMEDPAALACADEATLRRLLTTHVRADRFTEGHLATMFERGHFDRILERIEALDRASR
jgi:hypothetical protein